MWAYEIAPAIPSKADARRATSPCMPALARSTSTSRMACTSAATSSVARWMSPSLCSSEHSNLLMASTKCVRIATIASGTLSEKPTFALAQPDSARLSGLHDPRTASISSQVPISGSNPPAKPLDFGIFDVAPGSASVRETFGQPACCVSASAIILVYPCHFLLLAGPLALPPNLICCKRCEAFQETCTPAALASRKPFSEVSRIEVVCTSLH